MKKKIRAISFWKEEFDEKVENLFNLFKNNEMTAMEGFNSLIFFCENN